LRILEKTCEFGSIGESLIKDRLVCGVQETRLRERLLREMDLTLEKAVAIFRASELSRFQVKELEAGTHSGGANTLAGEIDAVKKEREGWKNKSTDQRFVRDCSKCGRNHLERKCPAFSRNSQKCGLKGHFASKCHSSQVQKQVQEMGIEEKLMSSDDEKSVGLSINTINSLKCGAGWTVQLETNGTIVRYKLDTGAQVNVLPRKIYASLKSAPVLKPAPVKLMPYGSSDPLPLDGQCQCHINYGKGHHLKFFVVPTMSSPLLGLDACQQLGLISRVNSVSVNHSKNDPVIGQYLDVFQSPGLLKNYVYKIQLKDGAVPYLVAVPRRVKLPLLPKLKQELHRMQSLGIIQEVTDPTDWVHQWCQY
jgi:hypothetical protein